MFFTIWNTWKRLGLVGANIFTNAHVCTETEVNNANNSVWPTVMSLAKHCTLLAFTRNLITHVLRHNGVKTCLATFMGPDQSPAYSHRRLIGTRSESIAIEFIVLKFVCMGTSSISSSVEMGHYLVIWLAALLHHFLHFDRIHFWQLNGKITVEWRETLS